MNRRKFLLVDVFTKHAQYFTYTPGLREAAARRVRSIAIKNF
jgi:hypothetical protein